MKKKMFLRLLGWTVALVAFGFLGAPPAAAVKFRFNTAIYFDQSGKALTVPEGVACGGMSAIIVSDTGNGRLLRFGYQNGVLETGSQELKVSGLVYPEKVMINSRGEIFVFDRKQRRIVRTTPEGRFLGYVEPKGLPRPDAWTPKSFTLDNSDRIYLLDISSQRVLVLNPEGTYERQIQFPEDYRFFSDLTVDFKGTVLLVDGAGGRVYAAAESAAKFSPITENLQAYVRYPARLTVDKRGRIYISDRNGGRIVVLGQDGAYLGKISDHGWKPGLLSYPAQICIGPQGRLFVADTLNHRIQIFELFE
jgi:sugar lactone lactonase YvrE